MKTKFTLNTTNIKAEIVMEHAEHIQSHQAAGIMANYLVGEDFVNQSDLVSLLARMSGETQFQITVKGVDPNCEFNAEIVHGALVKHEMFSGTGRCKSTASAAITPIKVAITEPATKMPRADDNYREVMNMDFHNLEVRIIAHYMVDPIAACELRDILGRTLANVLLRKPMNMDTLLIAENVVLRAVHDFCGYRCFSPEWFKVSLPQLDKHRKEEAEAAEKAIAAKEQAKEQRRIERVRGQVTRAVRAVRMSHVETLTAVMGDTEAADAVLNETEAHLQVYYGCAVNTKFHEVREHAVSVVNTYINDKLESLKANTTVVNNVNINIPEGADARLIQKTVNEISLTTLEMNGALPENQVHVSGGVKVVALDATEGESFQIGNVVMAVVGKPITFEVNRSDLFSEHTHKGREGDAEDSPCLKGLKGADRVQWLIDNVPAGYLSANLEMYTDFEDIKDWMLRVYHTKETIGDAFTRLYGYNPIETNWIPAQQHADALADLSAQIDKLTTDIMARDATIAEQINVIDKQNTNITSLSRANGTAGNMLAQIRNVIDGKA